MMPPASPPRPPLPTRRTPAHFYPCSSRRFCERGFPERLYVDNGAAYRSHHLALVCAKLGITLIHARPYRPQGKGKIERFFRTLRAQLLTRLTPEDTASLEALNRRLGRLGRGRVSPHAPPRPRRANTARALGSNRAEEVRFPAPTLDLDELFLFEAQRKVYKDRTVSLDGVVYEVDAALVGERVTLRYDPSAPAGRPIQVWHEDQQIQLAKPVDLYANCFVKRQRSAPTRWHRDHLPRAHTFDAGAAPPRR